MRNVQMSVEGDVLTIQVDLAQEGTPSQSGKSLVIGSTQGNQAVAHGGETVKVGVNVYRNADQPAKAETQAPMMAKGAKAVVNSRK